ncbi:MAG: hypothetical protein WKG06_30020 [Segetibacter sp.]
MKCILSAIIFLLLTNFSFSQKYIKLHFKSILADAHNDILTEALTHDLSFDQGLKGKTHSDLLRMKEAGIDVQIFQYGVMVCNQILMLTLTGRLTPCMHGLQEIPLKW